ncbi:metallophosphoesterase [Methylobacterium sp. CCH5-D2]|uniref:metallophosphoesterase n=1 Tax=Methylobacterium sp. CCH5-D2 TaxID=1768765 RepID=UPI00082AFD2D|nr:metallophosphoesterase [Methylobacterium sp. CCH5-D2]
MPAARSAPADLDQARREVDTVTACLREGFPPVSPAGCTTTKSAVRVAADRLGVDRRSLAERIGTPERPGSHARRFDGLAPDWSAYAKGQAERGELGTKPVLPGFVIRETVTRLDKHGAYAGETIRQAPATGGPYELPTGFKLKRVTAKVDAHGRLQTQWLKGAEDAFDPLAFAAELRAAMLDARGSAPMASAPAARDDDLLTVYVVPDLHLGMLAHGQECGEDYDLRIAAAMMRREMDRLLSMAPPSRHAVVLFLGDFFHANDQKNATPRSGHTLDVDSRWRKTYGVGARVAIGAATAVAERHELVEVAMLPGNHDEDAALTLAVALELYFEEHPRIEVASGSGIHWFRRFGKCLLGATHGHTMTPDRMAMMLATDRAKDWGETEHRHMLFGHIHHATAKEVGPVRVESFSTPAAKDAYAAAGGYRSTRALNAVTFHREDGEVCRHRVNIRAAAGEAARAPDLRMAA